MVNASVVSRLLSKAGFERSERYGFKVYQNINRVEVYWQVGNRITPWWERLDKEQEIAKALKDFGFKVEFNAGITNSQWDCLFVTK